MWKEQYHLLDNLMLHRHALSGMADRGLPVGPCVVDGTQRGETVIVQAAVRHPSGLEEGPHICIRPPQDGIHPHERGPAWAAGAELILAASIRIAPAASFSPLNSSMKFSAPTSDPHQGRLKRPNFLAQWQPCRLNLTRNIEHLCGSAVSGEVCDVILEEHLLVPRYMALMP